MTTDNHRSNEELPVVFIPGIVTPAELSYGPLLNVLGDQIRPIVKDLEIYATDAPPSNYGLEMEVEGILRAAEGAGARRFHLVGFSAGGAAALAFTAKYPERLRSLALIEPAWIGRIAAEDADEWATLGQIMTLPPGERMRAFVVWHMRPGVQPPAMQQPPGPPPAWMAKRPAGQEAMVRAFNTYKLDQNRFRLFHGPVYFALGSLTASSFEHAAQTLARLFPNFHLEIYEGRSHFDPPHRAEPERLARALQALWARGEAATTAK
jgi:pimeloyl-ACP methyl ester carboxylesterase